MTSTSPTSCPSSAAFLDHLRANTDLLDTIEATGDLTDETEEALQERRRGVPPPVDQRRARCRATRRTARSWRSAPARRSRAVARTRRPNDGRTAEDLQAAHRLDDDAREGLPRHGDDRCVSHWRGAARCHEAGPYEKALTQAVAAVAVHTDLDHPLTEERRTPACRRSWLWHRIAAWPEPTRRPSCASRRS